MIKREVGRVTVLTNPASGHRNARHAAEKAIERLQHLVTVAPDDEEIRQELARTLAMKHGSGGHGPISGDVGRAAHK